jgi:hypothetical protein
LLPDEVHRLVRQVAGDVIEFILGIRTPRLDVGTAHHLHLVARLAPDETVILDVDVRLIADIRRHAVEIIKADLTGPRLDLLLTPIVAERGIIAFAETQMPFADGRRCVTRLLEKFGEGESLLLEQQRRAGRMDTRRMVARRPPDATPRHQAIARRRANRAGRVGVGKAPAFACETINVRRLYFRRAIAPHVAITEVVGQDQHHIGFLFQTLENRLFCLSKPWKQRRSDRAATDHLQEFTP